MSERIGRIELEKQIIEKEWEINLSLSDLTWLDSDGLEKLLNAWGELAKYYASHADDTAISVEVLRSYLHYTRMLREILLNEDIDTKMRERAKDTLVDLEWCLEEIIKEVVTYLDSAK
jgi:hypothetical protein